MTVWTFLDIIIVYSEKRGKGEMKKGRWEQGKWKREGVKREQIEKQIH